MREMRNAISERSAGALAARVSPNPRTAPGHQRGTLFRLTPNGHAVGLSKLENTPVNLKLANFAGSASAQEWQLTNSNAITQLANVTVSAGQISMVVPAQSISLFVVPKM